MVTAATGVKAFASLSQPGAAVALKPLDCFFFLGSTYTYLSVCRADAVAQNEGIEINWRPFSVRTLMREQNNSPFANKPAKTNYMWRDIGRRAARFGIPFEGPQRYPIDPSETANHVAALAAMEGWCKDFVAAAYDIWFLQGDDPGDDRILRRILTGLGKSPERILAGASTPAVLQQYNDETARARELGIFGSPTYVSGTEIFWGDDRLEDALAWHKAHADGGD